jgi:type IV pilus assembly protein PilC
MIHAGEVSGNLDEILLRLAKFFERDADLKAKMSTALFYPVILLTVGVVVVIGIVVAVLPAFAKIFIDAKVPLPLPTHVLYQLNLFIRAYWKHLGVGIAVFAVVFKWYVKTPTGKLVMDTVMLKVPVYGVLVRQSAIARLTRTLGSLITSGVPMLQALDVTILTVDNAVITKVIKSVRASVSKGETISGPMKDSGEFPLMPVHMIAVGEETGALDTMLNKVADFYDMSTEISIKKVTALIEPIALVFIGSAVGFIFASILLPIFSMVKTLKK